MSSRSFEYVLVALAYACMVPRKQLRASDALLALYVAGSSIPILSQNAPQLYMFSLLALFAHLLALCRRSGREHEAAFRISRRMVTAALLAFLLPHPARQCIATTFFLGGALGGPAFADLRAIGLLRMEGVLTSESREAEYAAPCKAASPCCANRACATRR